MEMRLLFVGAGRKGQLSGGAGFQKKAAPSHLGAVLLDRVNCPAGCSDRYGRKVMPADTRRLFAEY